jgi:membrane-bound lytic murein transglycosylase B
MTLPKHLSHALAGKAFAFGFAALALVATIACPTAIAKPVKTASPAAVANAASAQETKTTASFTAFIEALWPDAKAAGVSRATFDAAFAGPFLPVTNGSYGVPQLRFAQSLYDCGVGAQVSHLTPPTHALAEG